MSKSESVDKKWIVKSSGKILGPMTFDEIATELRERKISMIDEIRSPEDRWMFIRENQAFTQIIQMLREQQADAREDTSTTFVGTASGTRTITQDLTPPPIKNVYPSPSPQAAKMPEVLEAAPVIEKPVQKLPVYASARDPKLQKRVATERKKTAFYGWMILILVVLGLAGLQLIPRKESAKPLGFEDLIKLAKANKAIGNFEKSLEFFRKAETIRPLDFSLQAQMVPLLMTVENQNVQARQILENLSKTQLESKARLDVESLLALSFLREGRLDEAQRRYQEIVQKNPDYHPAQLNLVEISILQGQFEAASEKIAELIKNGVKEPMLFIYRILTIYRTSDDPVKLEAAKSDLKRMLSQYHDDRSEMLLLLAALQKKLNQDLDVVDSLRSILETDPDLTKQHVHDLFVHREVLEWAYLGNICEILVRMGGDSSIYKGLNAYCVYEQGDLKGALDHIEKARAQIANDSYLIGLHSFLLFKAGRANEARAVLQLPKANDTDLGVVVKASMCETQKEWNCAEQNWKRILQKDSRHIGAYAGLARVALERGQQEMAFDYLKRGILLSSQYQPFLELKDRLNEH